MDNDPWIKIHRCWFLAIISLFFFCISSIQSLENHTKTASESVVDNALKNYIDEVLSTDNYSIIPGIQVEPTNVSIENSIESRSSDSIQEYAKKKLEAYSKNHVLSVDVPTTARFFFKADTGKSSFLAGFGMGFLAFALKKLLLPVFIGAQLIKSVLIAMFLPSILGSFGKILGKGLSTFSGISGASTGINNHNNNQIEDFEFKDISPYNNDGLEEYNADAVHLNLATSTEIPSTNSRFGLGNQRISYVPSYNENYYMRKPNKKTDYKVFHKIPSSSLLLTSYDPFYSPLLSRLDAIFQQLGLGNDKMAETEKCRERLVCLMYANPAKYAPFSNLVSAQLSRELNELRKPSSDNPEILRFFRYMKAAKDGQDGGGCVSHKGCPYLNENQPSPAIITVYNDINKLVQARKLA